MILPMLFAGRAIFTVLILVLGFGLVFGWWTVSVGTAEGLAFITLGNILAQNLGTVEVRGYERG